MRVRFQEERSALGIVCPAVAAKGIAPSCRPLTLCFAPLALLGAISALSAMMRAIVCANPPTYTTKSSQGDLAKDASAQLACQMATSVLTRIVGKEGKVRRATPISHYSIHATVPERQSEDWRVFCEVDFGACSGNYLVQIDVATGQIYAINYLEMTNSESSHRDGTSDNDVIAPSPLTREEAKAKAFGYLSLLGLSPLACKSINALAHPASLSGANGIAASDYAFTCNDDRRRCDSVFITIDRTDGKLQTLWRQAHPTRNETTMRQ